jgi:hypothetical protein
MVVLSFVYKRDIIKIPNRVCGDFSPPIPTPANLFTVLIAKGASNAFPASLAGNESVILPDL